MIEVLAPLLATACFILALRGVGMLRERGPLERFEGAAVAPAPEREQADPANRVVEYLGERLGPRVHRSLGERRRERIAARLDRAGRPGGMTVEGYARRKAGYGALGAIAGTLLSLLSGSVVAVLLITPIGWFWIDVWLARRGRLRQETIERDLPDFLDILAVSVRAGLGYRAAVARVADAVGGPVGEELTVALRQMGLGRSRREAFDALRDRNDSESLDQFVTAQLQAEELGVPLADAISDIATDMRREFHQAARRRAQRAVPRVSLIATAFIVPGAMILIVAGLFLGADIETGGVVR